MKRRNRKRYGRAKRKDVRGARVSSEASVKRRRRRYARSRATGFVVRLRALAGGAPFYVTCKKSWTGETFCEHSTPHRIKAHVFRTPDEAGAEIDAWRRDGFDAEIERAA